MKAYIIRIELIGSRPLIWRRVILPADATFKRLHDVIQSVTNFQSGYPSQAYHLYKFNLPKEHIIVTNDDLYYTQVMDYKKNKAKYLKRLENSKPEFREFERAHQKRLEFEVRKPVGIKIDAFIESNEWIEYTYDFGDNWVFHITLDKIVTDYYFGYPTLLDGAETAPLEDVGGLESYYEFLQVFKDENHPDHEDAVDRAKAMFYREYNFNRINKRLKAISYKKTQWNKIHHVNYIVVEDMYRK